MGQDAQFCLHNVLIKFGKNECSMKFDTVKSVWSNVYIKG